MPGSRLFSYLEKCRRKKCTRHYGKGIVGSFGLTIDSSKKFKRMSREAMDVCLPVLKESKKGSTVTM